MPYRTESTLVKSQGLSPPCHYVWGFDTHFFASCLQSSAISLQPPAVGQGGWRIHCGKGRYPVEGCILWGINVQSSTGTFILGSALGVKGACSRRRRRAARDCTSIEDIQHEPQHLQVLAKRAKVQPRANGD